MNVWGLSWITMYISNLPIVRGEAFLEMRLMTHGELDLERSFERVKTIIHQNVYGVEKGREINPAPFIMLYLNNYYSTRCAVE